MSDSFLGNFLPNQVHAGIKEANNLLLPPLATIEKENRFIIGKLENLTIAINNTNKKIDRSCPPKR